jgi:toxin ParE1/3/4
VCSTTCRNATVALADLAEIFGCIAADNREAAGRLVARIEHAAARIAASPHIGGVTRKPGFLRFPVGNYLIVYEIGNDEVVVHYVRHAARRRQWEGE